MRTFPFPITRLRGIGRIVGRQALTRPLTGPCQQSSPSPRIGPTAPAHDGADEVATDPLDDLNAPWRPPIRVVSSPRRTRTVYARLVGGVLELRVPRSMPESERRFWADRMRERIERQLRRKRPSDRGLADRAQTLNRRYFGGRLRWNSIGYADQESRWGSCAFATGVIRISRRAASLPDWVRDYLLV